MIVRLSRRPARGRSFGVAALVAIAAIAGACGPAGASPTGVSPGASPTAALPATATPAVVAAVTGTPVSAALLTPTSATSATATPAASATRTAAPTAAARTRVAWVHGQTVVQYVLTSPGTGWVRTTTGLWQTIDDGATWANAYPRTLLASHIRGFGALDANHALLAAVDVGASTSTYYIWHTANGGQSWAYSALPPITHDPNDPCCVHGSPDPPAVFDEVDANTAFVFIGMHTGTDGLNPHLFETTDGGVHWTARTYTFPDPGLGPPGPWRVQFRTPSAGVAEYANMLSSTTSGWGHWTHQGLVPDYFSYPTISFISATNWAADGGLFYGTVEYHYAMTSDSGTSWWEHRVDVPGVAGVEAAQVKFVTPTEWIGTEQTAASGGFGPSQTIVSADGGAHWSIKGPQPFNGSMASFVDTFHGWTGPNETLTSARRLLTP
jgi:hypothetical protein